MFLNREEFDELLFERRQAVKRHAALQYTRERERKKEGEREGEREREKEKEANFHR